ncbi:MAG: hypothetical protein K8F91_06550, partial [Candidatus Obscuribacterales bacterium]|nr:hypothetical protein [Candidatus Obscuribacterales bacterium]
MGEPAKEVENVDAITIEGFEEIFNGSARESEGSQDGSNRVTEGLSLKEACDFYELKATAIRMKLKTGEIFGEKIEGKNGPEWRIYPDRVTTPQQDGATTVMTGDRQGVTMDGRLIDLVEELSDKLASSQKELQGAAFRNGYLEAQLEGYKEQIKLLP